MIAPLAQGALLMSVIYCYSKSMFNLINDYYRDEFKSNILAKVPENLPNEYQPSSDEKVVEGIEDIIKSSPSIEGLVDILKEDITSNRDIGIITRSSSDIFNEKESKHIPSQQKEKFNDIQDNIDEEIVENQENAEYSNKLNYNSQSVKKNKIDGKSLDLDNTIPTSTLKLESSSDHDAIYSKEKDCDYILYPSRPSKSNDGKITNHQVPITSHKHSSDDFITSGDDVKNKLPINDNSNNNIVQGCSSSNTDANECRKKNGNYPTNVGSLKNVMTASTISLPTLKSSNKLYLYKNEHNPPSQSTSFGSIDRGRNPISKDMNICRRKSVSEYIEFWSNFQH